MRKMWHDEAWDEYIYWQSQDKKTLKKINKLLTDIERNGYSILIPNIPCILPLGMLLSL